MPGTGKNTMSSITTIITGAVRAFASSYRYAAMSSTPGTKNGIGTVTKIADRPGTACGGSRSIMCLPSAGISSLFIPLAHGIKVCSCVT